MSLNAAERRILDVLQRNGRIPNAKLAQRVGLSETSCLRRLRLLEEAGIITGYKASLDAEAVGLGVSAFVLVNTNQRTETDRSLFLDAVRDEPRIVQCAAVSGPSDFILQVVARDIEALGELTMSKLLGLPTVSDVATMVVFKWIKLDEPLPL